MKCINLGVLKVTELKLNYLFMKVLHLYITYSRLYLCKKIRTICKSYLLKHLAEELLEQYSDAIIKKRIYPQISIKTKMYIFKSIK